MRNPAPAPAPAPAPDAWLEAVKENMERKKKEEYYGAFQNRLQTGQLEGIDNGRLLAKNLLGDSFGSLPPAISDALSITLLALSGAKWLSVLLPPLGFAVFALLSYVENEIQNPSEPRTPPPRSYLLPEELSKQEEREKNPIPFIMEKVGIAPTLDYLLQKNQLDTLKTVSPTSPRIPELEKHLLALERQRGFDPGWIPFICTNIGTPPFNDEALSLLLDLHYKSRQTLVNEINVTGLNLKANLQQAIQNMQIAANETAFNAALNSLTNADRNILLGLCSIKRYSALKKRDLETDITVQYNNPLFKTSIEGAALNRYISRFQFHGVRGVINDGEYKNVLRESGASSTVADFRAKVLNNPVNARYNLSDIWSNNGLCITSPGSDGREPNIEVNFSAKSDSMATFLHECNHAAISAHDGDLKGYILNLLRTMIDRPADHPLPNHNQLLRDIDGLHKEMQLQIHEYLRNDPNFPGIQPLESYTESDKFLTDLGLNLDANEKKILLQMMDNPNYRLSDSRGRPINNNIPREKNKLMQVYSALTYFNNLRNGPNYAANRAIINNFIRNPAYQDLIDSYIDCYHGPALQNAYNFENPVAKTEEVLARILPRLPQFHNMPSLSSNPCFLRISQLLQGIKGGLYRTAIPAGLRSDLTLGRHAHVHHSKDQPSRLDKIPGADNYSPAVSKPFFDFSKENSGYINPNNLVSPENENNSRINYDNLDNPSFTPPPSIPQQPMPSIENLINQNPKKPIAPPAKLLTSLPSTHASRNR